MVYHMLGNLLKVLRDNLGDNWDEACATLMTEMRMYELECLRSFKNIFMDCLMARLLFICCVYASGAYSDISTL